MNGLGNVPLKFLGPQDDLPGKEANSLGGSAWRCGGCGTRLRPGQGHIALVPYPHQSFDLLEGRE